MMKFRYTENRANWASTFGIIILTLLTIPGSFSQIWGQNESSFHPLGQWRKITSKFGYRDDPFHIKSREREFHKGIDLDVEIGDTVYAWRSGIVSFTGKNKVSGNMINIQHSQNYVTKYHHLIKILVKSGETVQLGQSIGLAGNTGKVTGSHLHFTLAKNGKPVDPYYYLKNSWTLSDLKKPAKKKILIYKHFVIKSYPVDGKLIIDGENFGKTPLEIKLPYGEHFIEVDSGEKYQRFIGRIWIDRNFNYNYSARLTLKTK